MKNNITYPFFIHQILRIFEDHNAQAFLVGGCVRDMLMNRELHDYDITSNAHPEEMSEWFKEDGYKVIPTGVKHGTISVLIHQEAVEITTFRKESGYHNHRSPEHVTFSSDLTEDLKRRDFTINAIAYHPKSGILDPFHGQEDIEANIIRCVGEPMERFEEDALRILRALRFSCTLKFTIEDKTWLALQHHASDLQYISSERIREEFNRILMAEHPHTLKLLKDAGVLTHIIPEYEKLYNHPQLTPWHIFDIFEHSDVALDHTRGYSLPAKLAIVFHDIGKPQCESFDENGVAHYKGHAHVSQLIAQDRLKKLHYDNKTIERVCILIQYHDYYLHPKRNILRHYLSKFDNDLVFAFEALDMQVADNYAKNPKRAESLIENIEACKSLMLQMEKEQDLFSMKDLCINGSDLMAMGFKGKQIGDLLKELFQRVLDDPSLNNKKALQELIKKRML